MEKNKCVIKIEAEDRGKGDVDVKASYEGPAYLIGETLANSILNMENTDMDIVFKLFTKIVSKKFKEQLEVIKNGK